MNLAAVQNFSLRGDRVGQALNPAVVTLGASATLIPATVPDPRRETLAIEGGSADEGELIVRILKADLPTRPTEQTLLRWRRPTEASLRAPTWRIIVVRDSALDQAWSLRCIPAQ